MSISKVYRINDRWTLQTLLVVALATDNRNRSSDAWQFRGGVFGIYKANEQWQWTVGAIALGRDDLRAVPALGAVWTPTPRIRWDLIPPNPKLNFLVKENENQENWIYLGAGFAGTTWGYRTSSNLNDRLPHGDRRIICGWQTQPITEPGVPFASGRKSNIELGYNFSRELEFNNELVKVPLNDAWMSRMQTRY